MNKNENGNYWIFDNNIIKSYQNTKNEIIYEADTTFYREHNSEGFEYESFAKSLNIALLYYDNELKYQTDDWDEFESKHLLFEAAIIQGNGFFIMISGKQFIYPFYMFLLIYIIVNSIVLTFSIIFFKIFSSICYKVYRTFSCSQIFFAVFELFLQHKTIAS